MAEKPEKQQSNSAFLLLKANSNLTGKWGAVWLPDPGPSVSSVQGVLQDTAWLKPTRQRVGVDWPIAGRRPGCLGQHVLSDLTLPR
jgi:hypothetical protein